VSRGSDRLDIAVIGTGIAGMSAAWLLSQRHQVTVYEQAGRLGGHSNTISVPAGGATLPVDMGFIVYNEATYPNLSALFRHLGVATRASDMSLAVSLDDGALEYAGTDLLGLFAQKRNLFRPRFWLMLRDLLRFYREAPGDPLAFQSELTTLGDYLRARGYGAAFIEDHLLPMAAAIWSTPCNRVMEHPAASFVRFCDNHGLLQLRDRPIWRTVQGGSRAYVQRLTERYAERVRLGQGVRKLRRGLAGVHLWDAAGHEHRHDHVVIAAHADDALAMLADPSAAELRLLSALTYGDNLAVMHCDSRLMPRRRRAWSSWNYIGSRGSDELSVTYWMNRLQGFATPEPVLVTLNPLLEPAPETVIHREHYRHPVLDAGAIRVQRALWSLQGERRTWFCGAYFGAGFHEDGLQAGLAVAEALGGLRRPWRVPEESGRIHLPGPLALEGPLGEAAA